MPPYNNNPLPQQPPAPIMQPVFGGESKKSSLKNVIFTALLFILAPAFALLMILFVFQSYVVEGSSMEPTLQNGNRVFILKLPKTIDRVSGKTYIPSRHEIIVFKKTSDPNVQLIKRVIGLPGDHVVVKDGKITVYNEANPTGFNPDDNTNYGKNLASTVGNVDIYVGQNELFVCGDNRVPGASLDSRSGLGLVPVENVIGQLWVRYFPLSEFKTFSLDKALSLTFYLQFSSTHSLSYKI